MKQLKKAMHARLKRATARLKNVFTIKRMIFLGWKQGKMERCQKYWYGGKIIEKDDEIRVERRYYISSLQTDAALFAKAVTRALGYRGDALVFGCTF
ncbi:hypothetical protein ACT7DZ_10980 [Bacillus cereus]